MNLIRSTWLVCGIVAVVAALAVAAPGSAKPQAAEKRPNIIVILSDDMGYSDLGCFGGEIETPVLDSLAKNGLRFTQFYNTARCCPTRASLLTGLYPHQAGIGHMVDSWSPRLGEGYAGDLNDRCLTIAQVLKNAGYATYMTGKWHVTPKIEPDQPETHSKKNWPMQRGFDRFYGTIHGAGSFYDPNTLTRGNEMISPYADPEYKPESYYYTDAISDHATRFIKEHVRDHGDKPFFMYVAYTSPHWPMQAPAKDVAKNHGKYSEGYDVIRQRRIARMREMGLIDAQWEPNATVGDWSKIEDKEWEQRGMEVYAAMIEIMDRGIGRMVKQLEESGELDNTLILYMQDNGGCAEGLGRMKKDPARADKPTLPPMDAKALQVDMIPKQTRDGYPVLQGRKVLPGPADTYIAYGENWANVSNTPFREYKHWVHEGGISTPLIAHWPAGIKKRGAMDATPSHLIDIMATCVDVADADYPSRHNGEQVHPMEGVSLAPAFGGGEVERGEPIFWEHEGNRAVRQGKWKLVAKGPHGKWELYDMAADRTEMHDLAAKQPERVKKMAGQWETWAKRALVLPWPWEDEGKKK